MSSGPEEILVEAYEIDRWICSDVSKGLVTRSQLYA